MLVCGDLVDEITICAHTLFSKHFSGGLDAGLLGLRCAASGGWLHSPGFSPATWERCFDTEMLRNRPLHSYVNMMYVQKRAIPLLKLSIKLYVNDQRHPGLGIGGGGVCV